MFYKIKSLRKIILPLLKKYSKDFWMSHHWTEDKFFLNSYLHKGYWFHGKNREKATLQFYERIIRQGDIVIEVGGHIGYFSLFFSKLVGVKGKVFVFEPGDNNIEYTKRNIAQKNNIELYKKAIGDKNGKEKFYMDGITGQNNSLVKEFKGLEVNMAYAMDKAAKVTETMVETITMDTFCLEKNVKPNFIKIDVEGFEYNVLCGMEKTIHSHPIIMIEVQKNQELIYDFFQKHNYILYNALQEKVTKEYIKNCVTENIFCFHNAEVQNLQNNLILKS